MLAALKTMLRPAAALLSGMGAQAPVNLRARDSSPQAIDRDVAYALSIGLQYRELIQAHGYALENRRVLELGPGYNFGSVMVLACCGALPMVADRFLVPWEQAYHAKFYAALKQALPTKLPGVGLDLSPLDRLVSAGAHAPEIIRTFGASTEELTDIPDATVDIVLSNAVLEHLANPRQALAQLSRITRPGGLGLHQVDFRDHRDFDRPLEYLLLDPGTFESMFVERHGECGRQLRPLEMGRMFREAGFAVMAYDSNILAPEAYLDDFLPRLAKAPASLYKGWSRAALQSVSGRFHLFKPPVVPDALRAADFSRFEELAR